MPFPVIERDLQLPVDSGNIITISGVRRCGKSSHMRLVANKLLERGIDRRRILWIDFDDERFAGTTSEDLYLIIQAYREMFPDQSLSDAYLFFDEIQLVPNWELFVLRLYKSYCRNIYVSGSNSQMLSEQLTTALRGWPLEYREYPLSFGEYLRFNGIEADCYSEQGQALLKSALKEYLSGSAFPEVVLEKDPEVKARRLQGYFDTMLLRDMMEHFGLNNPTLIRYFLKRVMLNLTKPTSVNKIRNELQSQGFKMSNDFLYHVLSCACSVFLLYSVPKYSPSLVKESNALSKYYVADTALRSSVLVPQSADEGKCLENAVFMHLLRKRQPMQKISYYAGKGECDFVVQTNTEVTQLLQVTKELNDIDMGREVNGLLEASRATACPSMTLITLDREGQIDTPQGPITLLPAHQFLLS